MQKVSHLFYVIDYFTGFKFLIDTDAQVSVFPLLPTDRHNHYINLTLEAVNGTPTQPSVNLPLGLRHS